MLKTRIVKRIYHSPVARNTAWVFIVSSLASVPMFFLPSLIAYYYQVSAATDNFFFAYAIVYYLANLLRGAVSTLVVPFTVERLADKPRLETFISGAFSLVSVASVVLTIVCYAVLLLVKSFINPGLAQATALFLPIIYFLVLNSLFGGILNSFKKYTVYSLMPLISGLYVYVVTIVFNQTLGIYSVMVGFLLGEAVLFLFCLYYLRKILQIVIKPNLNNIYGMKDFAKGSTEQFIGSGLAGGSPLVDKAVASRIALGSISLLDYGQKLFSGFNAILSSFFVVMLPVWAENIGKEEDHRSMIKFNIRAVTAISAVIVFVGLIAARPLLRVMYPTVADYDFQLIVSIVKINIIALLFISPMQVVNRFVIIFKYTHLIVRISIVKFILNVVFDIVFTLKFGLLGLPLATLLNQGIGYLLMAIWFYKEFDTRYAKT